MSLNVKSTPKKLASSLRRRTSGHGRPTVDMNADVQGRRTSGETRLDVAVIDRHFRV